MNKYLSFVAIFMFFFACDSEEWDEPELASAFCFTDRQTIEVIKDQPGVVTKFGDSYHIEITQASSTLRFVPCNLPEYFQQDNLSVVFSGKQKEVFANERWAGMPMELIKIKKGAGF
mgnify:CR=1 FL=1